MPFAELIKTRESYTGLHIDVPCMSGVVTVKKEQHIYIKLPRALINQLWHDKLVNNGRTVKLGILEGTETDAGFIMLVHNPVGYTFSASAYGKRDGKPSQAAFVCKVELATFKHHAPTIMPQPTTPLEFSIDGPTMLLQLPPWFVHSPKHVVRSTMVPTEKQAPGRPPAALANQRRLVR